MSKEEIIKQLECIFCGSYKNLEPKKYTKTVTKSRGHTHYTRTKSIITPVCSKCIEMNSLQKKRDTQFGVLTFLWVLIFFVALICSDFFLNTGGLFWLMLPINTFGLILFTIILLVVNSSPFNMRSSVKFEPGYNNNAVSIFSRKKGKWISYQEWMSQVVEERVRMEGKPHPLFPNKKSIIFKLQYFGAIVCLLSMFFPTLISLSGNSICITWIGNIFFTTTPPGTVPPFSTFNHILTYSWDSPFYNSGLFGIVYGNYAMIVAIGAISFFSLRNANYLKKIEGSIKMNQIIAFFIGLGQVAIAIVSLLLPIFFNETISFSISSYSSSMLLLNIQFYVMLVGAIMTISAFFIAVKKDFKIEIDLDSFEELVGEPSYTTVQYTKSSPVMEYESNSSEGEKFCHNCGNKLSMSDEFCQQCGTKQKILKNI